MQLTSKNVRLILMDCLFKEGEDTTNHVIGEGVMKKLGFHPERLKSHEKEVSELLDQLPDLFKKSSGGGWSFLNACITASGELWGQHENIDELLCLSIALNKVIFLVERKLWTNLPGGMPYFVIL